MAKRVIWIVLDSAGIGEEPDADKFGDVGSDTFGHILETYPDAKFDNLTKLGLRAIENTSFYDAATKQDVIGVYGKAQELSNGKDTTTGHWEMIGIHTKHAFPTYPNGFPQEIIDAFIEQTGCGAIYGNKVASGIPIIAEYGEEHMKTSIRRQIRYSRSQRPRRRSDFQDCMRCVRLQERFWLVSMASDV